MVIYPMFLKILDLIKRHQAVADSQDEALAIDDLEDPYFNMKDQSSADKWRTGCIFNNQFSVQENRHETAGKIRLLLQIPHAVASLIIFDYGI